MKGPAIFLATLALAGAAGVALVLPAMRARSAAVDRLLEAPAAGQATIAAEQRLSAGADRLATALALRSGDGGTAGVSEMIETLGREFGVTRERTSEPGQATFRLPWTKLPDFLIRLSGFAAPVLAGVRAEPTDQEDICRVQVAFALPGAPSDRR